MNTLEEYMKELDVLEDRWQKALDTDDITAIIEIDNRVQEINAELDALEAKGTLV